jgi:transketolase N-terminal domain/subunit
MHYHSEALIRELAAKAQTFRINVLEMVYCNQTGHIGGAFSAADMLAALYFHHLNVDPARPDWPERDRLILSKGHACAALYNALAYRGFLPVEELMTFRQLDSRLQGHRIEQTARNRDEHRAVGPQDRGRGRHGAGATHEGRQAILARRAVGARRPAAPT